MFVIIEVEYGFMGLIGFVVDVFMVFGDIGVGVFVFFEVFILLILSEVILLFVGYLS